MGVRKDMTAVIVQCRLSSVRLPEKALLPLGPQPAVAWTLNAMKQVPADRYILACDEASFERLHPIASGCGWECMAGPADDVLERFCRIIEHINADTVVRATADNPFLFYEAAARLLERYGEEDCDYITWIGLPHGSGVEVFDAASLLAARTAASGERDHEHVGPALYEHGDRFVSVFAPCPSEWRHPELRTTIDTPADYRRALRIVRAVSRMRSSGEARPYTAEEICCACVCAEVSYPVLCVPSVSSGHGTGHLRRCLSVAAQNGYDVYIPEQSGLHNAEQLAAEYVADGRLESWQIVRDVPQRGAYALILTDSFMLERSGAAYFASCAPVASLDEGSAYTDFCDYLLDIIPSGKLERAPNMQNPALIELPAPEHCRAAPEEGARAEPQRVLVCFGGEDPAGLTVPAAAAAAACGKQVTAVVEDPKEAEKLVPEQLKKNIAFAAPIADLREKLYLYDAVITHYGFTAFEAVAAGCGVLLLGTTQLHFDLGKRFGFAVLAANAVTARRFELLFANPDSLYPAADFAASFAARRESLSAFIKTLARGRRIGCPVCGSGKKAGAGPDAVTARAPDRTYRRCAQCGMLYLSWIASPAACYNDAYFFEDYKKQYGKTYLEDFNGIKETGKKRISVIESFLFDRNGANKKRGGTPVQALDIGCAMGPFLSAAAEAGWQVYGTDISPEAVAYVQNTLTYPAVCTQFPDFDPVKEFGIAHFDVVTMWYVIEHFADLDAVLQRIAQLVRRGGIFAFATPSASGVSAKYFSESFYRNSPADHYTLWEPSRAGGIVSRYGFKVVKLISTGHHPERFPAARVREAQDNARLYKLLRAKSKLQRLGDTFEAYCIKEYD